MGLPLYRAILERPLKPLPLRKTGTSDTPRSPLAFPGVRDIFDEAVGHIMGM